MQFKQQMKSADEPPDAPPDPRAELNEVESDQPIPTAMCSHFTEHGSCPQGQNCQFSHGMQELRQAGGQAAASYETVLCKVWLDTGVCGNRAQCGAAHGQNELRVGGGGGEGGGMRQMARGGVAAARPGYKIQPCRNMKDTGHCSSGPACQFAHSAEVRGVEGEE